MTDGHKSTCPFYRTDSDWHRRSTDDEDTTDDDDLSSVEFDDDVLSTDSDSSGEQQSMAFKLTAVLKNPFRSHDAQSSSSTDLSLSDDTSVLSERPEERLNDDSTTSRNVETCGKKSFCYSCLHTTRNCRHKRAAREKAKARNLE